MPHYELQIVFADGTPAADALVSVADAPASIPDLGHVADAAGRVSLDGPAGDYSFSVWVNGVERRVRCELGAEVGVQVLRLPA